jgi:hypothetical protein
MSDNVTRFPGRRERTRLKNIRERKVACEVSSRWLQLGKQSDAYGDGPEYLHVDVMTLDQNEKPRKLCELIVDARDLRAVLGKLPRVAR